jgi:tetratricopeptide (TPR) repeat protein
MEITMKPYQIKGLVNKITKDDFDLNNSFYYYGQKINCQSGTKDYVDVTINDRFNFSFDFWTKELVFNNEDEKLKAAIVSAFSDIYNDKFQSVKVYEPEDDSVMSELTKTALDYFNDEASVGDVLDTLGLTNKDNKVYDDIQDILKQYMSEYFESGTLDFDDVLTKCSDRLQSYRQNIEQRNQQATTKKQNIGYSDIETRAYPDINRNKMEVVVCIPQHIDVNKAIVSLQDIDKGVKWNQQQNDSGHLLKAVFGNAKDDDAKWKIAHSWAKEIILGERNHKGERITNRIDDKKIVLFEEGSMKLTTEGGKVGGKDIEEVKLLIKTNELNNQQAEFSEKFFDIFPKSRATSVGANFSSGLIVYDMVIPEKDYSENIKKAIDYLKSIKGEIPSNFLEQENLNIFKAVCEKSGWSVYVDGNNGFELSQYSPAGEDFSFYIHSKIEDFAMNVKEYADSFDTGEHVGMWIGARNAKVGGVPSNLELIKDAENIKEMLRDLAEQVTRADKLIEKGYTLDEILKKDEKFVEQIVQNTIIVGEKNALNPQKQKEAILEYFNNDINKEPSKRRDEMLENVAEAFGLPKNEENKDMVFSVIDDYSENWEKIPGTPGTGATLYEELTKDYLQAIILNDCREHLLYVGKDNSHPETPTTEDRLTALENYFSWADHDKITGQQEVLKAFEIPKECLSPSLENILKKHDKSWNNIGMRLADGWDEEELIPYYNKVIVNYAKDLENFKYLLPKIAKHPVVTSKIEVEEKTLTTEQKMGLVLGKTIDIENVTRNQIQGYVTVTIKNGKLEKEFKTPKQYQKLPVDVKPLEEKEKPATKKQFKIS